MFALDIGVSNRGDLNFDKFFLNFNGKKTKYMRRVTFKKNFQFD